MLVALFIGYVIIWSLFHRDDIPDDEKESSSLAEKFQASRRLIPVILLIVGVIGSIYSGIASPTDAAAVGVLLSLLLSWFTGSVITSYSIHYTKLYEI